MPCSYTVFMKGSFPKKTIVCLQISEWDLNSFEAKDSLWPRYYLICIFQFLLCPHYITSSEGHLITCMHIWWTMVYNVFFTIIFSPSWVLFLLCAKVILELLKCTDQLKPFYSLSWHSCSDYSCKWDPQQASFEKWNAAQRWQEDDLVIWTLVQCHLLLFPLLQFFLLW